MGKALLTIVLVTAIAAGGLVCLASQVMSPTGDDQPERERSLSRLSAFVACQTDPGETASATCIEAFDWTGDGAVTLRDWAELEVWISQQS